MEAGLPSGDPGGVRVVVEVASPTFLAWTQRSPNQQQTALDRVIDSTFNIRLERRQDEPMRSMALNRVPTALPHLRRTGMRLEKGNDRLVEQPGLINEGEMFSFWQDRQLRSLNVSLHFLQHP